MKRIVFTLAAAGAALFGWSDTEITLVESEVMPISVQFGIKGYIPSNKDVVRIEKTSDTALRLTALKVGRCDIEVTGDNDSREKFLIEVRPSLVAVMKNLQRELERVPEVHCTIINGAIRVDGEVQSIKKWNYMMKVIKGYGKVRNFAEFTPGPEILLRMKESLQQSGFDVVFKRHAGEPESWKANCVALEYSKVNRTMTVQAKVYTPEQQAKILECLKAEKRWLVVDPKDKEAFDDEIQIKGNVQVVVAKPVIRLSVAYMAVDDSDISTIGNPNVRNGASPLNLGGTFQTLQNLLHGGGNHGNIAQLNANLDVAANFLKENGISRISETGYTLIESWDKDGARFKSGGTTFVRVAGGDAADLKEIPYGFEIKAKGGMMDDANMAVDFDFGISTVTQTGPDTYDRKEDISKQKINCPIGRTTLIGGFHKFADDKTLKGLPVLRNTPIFNWFFAADDGSVEDRKLLVMVCPEIVDNTQDTKPDVNKEINIAVPKAIANPKPVRPGSGGFWSWFSL